MFVQFAYGLLYLWLGFMRLIGWFRWSVEGTERLPPREASGMIIAMNHVHWIDIPIIGAMLPFRYRLSWMGKAELFENPAAGLLLRAMDVVPIKRGQRDLAALDSVVAALRAGKVLLIFPEGTRGRTGILRAGRGGTVRIAMQAQVPIVPVALTGTELGFWGTIKRRPVHVTIGEPYRIEVPVGTKIPADQMARLTDDLMGRIAILLPEERRGIHAPKLAEGAPLGERE
ncbi:1-acyl-sn-glycerol-3-phosphate acyltransferase [Candidatus Chloroploca sp. M-50]|uniref:1-acyl-sn-glycerol-3-phosphate acyltransferase n=1 Tax=Candidatus Chloroploca mongolica TaxID=2528176 RepID=A0ABS4DEU1_9CHLR|nr:lysophospholipid acyltransferase family protein [Candidatus Chloroploca mongolica]MBP1467977.1 1-acyl-sn-glycerol-3-phosphate acyltransferase [Candidatus Chloroploca mongolica]